MATGFYGRSRSRRAMTTGVAFPGETHMAEIARRVLRPAGLLAMGIAVAAWAVIFAIVTGFVFYTAWVAWTSPAIE